MSVLQYGLNDAPRQLPPAAASAAASRAEPVRFAARSRPAAPARQWRWGGGVPKRNLLFTTLQLAIMTRAGIDFASALDTVAKQCRCRPLQEALRQVHADVSSGVPVSEALARQSHVFGEMYVASAAAGEASGRLPEVLDQLAQLQRSEMRFQTTIRTLLGYPALLATVCAGVLAAMVLFVLPNFAEIFADSEVPLPILTQILLAVAEELRGRLWLWGLLAGGAAAAAVSYLRSEAGRRWRDRGLLRVRMLADVSRALLTGRAFRLLATLLDSGVTLVEGLQLVGNCSRNSLVRDTFEAVRRDVLNGRGMASSLLAAEAVPGEAAEMVAMAERTGSLALVARLIGEYFEEEGESRLRALVGMLEPAIVEAMGAVVALVVLSVMLPMFDLVTLAQQSN